MGVLLWLLFQGVISRMDCGVQGREGDEEEEEEEEESHVM